MNYKKANWNELQLGKKFYFEMVIDHKLVYEPVIIIDLTNNKVSYKYESNWKEYQTKSLYKEIGLYKEDEQLTLF